VSSFKYPVSIGPTWLQSIALKEIPGSSTLSVVGKSTGDGDIGVRGNIRTGGAIWLPLSSPERMSIVSTDAGDTVLGVGARTLKVSGLDSDYEEIEELVDLDGLTPVLTTQSFLRINDLLVLDWGSGVGKHNLGQISATAELSLTNQGIVDSEYNRANLGSYTVPVNKSVLFFAFTASMGKGDEVEVAYEISPFGLEGFFQGGGISAYESLGSLSGLVETIEAKTDIRFAMVPFTQNPSVSITLYGIERTTK